MTTKMMTRERMETKLAKISMQLDELNITTADLGQRLMDAQAAYTESMKTGERLVFTREAFFMLHEKLQKAEKTYGRKMDEYRNLRNYLNS
jgi:hypothetical protein